VAFAIAAICALLPARVARASTGPWFWPVAAPPGVLTPVVLRGFAPPARRWDAGHRGVDLAARAGAPVRAAGAGVVTFAGPLFGRDVIAISHGTFRTTYLPVMPKVSVGQRVAGGQVIGTVALASPASCDGAAACLHWGLVTGHGHAERYRDPLALVGEDQVRLLPLWSTEPPSVMSWSPGRSAANVTMSPRFDDVVADVVALPAASPRRGPAAKAFDIGATAGRVLTRAGR
jgi:murein DD-endopeptidase MepM/ murein hydrolase activator NlpD